MPFVRLTLIPAQTAEVTKRLTTDLTALVAADLGKRYDLTSVLLETPDAAHWAIGGIAHDVAAHLEICVTAGTNSDAEKRAFVANAMRLLRQEMPTLATATYVVVTELPGTNWGYDGETQADRVIKAR